MEEFVSNLAREYHNSLGTGIPRESPNVTMIHKTTFRAARFS
jgi:hypothetical protein